MAGSASRYARAIFELAQEEGGVEDWSRELEVIRSVLENPSARAILDNPSLAGETRQQAVGELGLPGIRPQGLNLMRLLVASGRTGLIGEIEEQYAALADESAGRVRATITTAIPLSDGDRQSLGRDLSRQLGKDVRLEARVDPSILGGLVLQVGDRLTDASVAARLEQLRRQVLVK